MNSRVKILQFHETIGELENSKYSFRSLASSFLATGNVETLSYVLPALFTQAIQLLLSTASEKECVFELVSVFKKEKIVIFFLVQFKTSTNW